MQYEIKHTKYTEINTNKSIYAQWNGPSVTKLGMLNDNRKIDYRNRFSFLCLYYRFSILEMGTRALAAVSAERLLVLLIIKVKPLTSVDTSRSAPCIVSGGLAAWPTGLPSRPTGRSVWLQIVCWQDAGSSLSPHRHREDIISDDAVYYTLLSPFLPHSLRLTECSRDRWQTKQARAGGSLFSLRVQSVCRPASPPPTSTAASALRAAQHVLTTNGHCDVKKDNREKSIFSKQ